MKRIKLFVPLLLVVSIFFTACGATFTSIQLEDMVIEAGTSEPIIAEYEFEEELGEKDIQKAAEKLTYISSDETIATIDKDGKITAIKAGEVTLTVTAPNGVSESMTLTVTPLVEGLEIPEEMVLPISDGEETKSQLVVSALPEGALLPELLYDSSDETIATIDEEGFVTAHQKGECTIGVMSEDGKFSGSVKIRVVIQPTGIGLENESGWLTVGSSTQLKPYTLPEGAEEGEYTFSSSDTSIASVDEDGTVTAKKAGNATITVSDGTFFVDYSLTVKNKASNSSKTNMGAAVTGNTSANTSSGNAAQNPNAPAPSTPITPEQPPTNPSTPPSDVNVSDNVTFDPNAGNDVDLG